MEKRKLILDVDTGSDDSVAIICALLRPEFEVLGLTTVNGNRCVDYTTENTLRISELMGGTTPVYRGCANTYISIMLGRRPGYPRRDGSGPANNAGVHGDFIDQCPPATIKEQEIDAVSWLVKTLMEAEDDSITLVPLGPLTNIAHAVAIQPKIVNKVHEIMYMGGGYKIGNKSAVGEMNVWLDPDAAQVVLSAGFKKITFVPLDATHKAYLLADDAARIRAIGTPASDVCASLIEQRIKGYSTWQKMVDTDELATPLHDPLCVMALLDPTVLQDVVHAHCEIDCGGGAAYGQTIFDIFNGRLDALPPNCYVALSADREKYVDLLVETLQRSK
ncbi:nucleoside hydrolase [Neobittarella massiliensis]|uniref:nucleoside hydrolase n=1 Tax=Neobittarella massiliensis (ex Bilen et al. 2018) TaxID=2041842 RepID=UPI000CF6760C|nr:nucleoside hydrolase [Neobittarella massiliensis]